ncbi:MAG: metalloregulator ArsR/SmtB family transcription factor [Anaerolineaceae bacterium]|nr:metalloregulator ArsR/SmtB family transcription factor [Anaerolineaceae bacterium]MBN2677736.1 metalloregulator ArsR/SmtB family transcription factor [Anaerolineaceae bacterium]
MYNTDILPELLTFFKALSDENRLKIIGLLAQRPYPVEELASTLNLSESTTSHHLARLAGAGLVKARVDGHYYYYQLDLDALHESSQHLLHDETLPKLAKNLTSKSYEKKVLAAFLDADGCIKAFPAQEKKLQVLLQYVVKAFEPGVRYPEQQLNEVLARYNEDTAFLRRSLVEYRLMERQGGGGEYWVTPKSAGFPKDSQRELIPPLSGNLKQRGGM